MTGTVMLQRASVPLTMCLGWFSTSGGEVTLTVSFNCQLDTNLELSRKREPQLKSCPDEKGLCLCDILYIGN